MMGYKLRRFKVYREISLEELVPEDNFYRQVHQAVDFTFVRDLVQHLYSDFGRSSIDPVVFFKLQLIAFFEGIRSERQLMEQVHLNIAHRWFIGYDLQEAVPDHSSLTKIRERYGLEVFHQFFEQIVALCAEAGLVWGEEIFFDGTKVQANADIGKMVARAEDEVQHHVENSGKSLKSKLIRRLWQIWWRNTTEKKSPASENHTINAWLMRRLVRWIRMLPRCGLPGVGVPFWDTMTITWWMAARPALS